MTEEYVLRTCTRVLASGQKEIQPLAFYRNLPAYVLLGDSGVGKTTAFKTEAQACGGEYITARNFITFEGRKEQSNTALFIDGLDEIRIGNNSPFNSIDTIRKHLNKLKIPFRLSCREADWLGENDNQSLQDVLKNDTELVVLHLNPLTEENIREILEGRGINNPEDFIETAQKHRLQTLLYNPQILNLLIKAVSENKTWPESCREVYKMACSELISEENSNHRRHPNDSDSQLQNSAGYLCAIQLLAGISGFALDKGRANDQYIDIKKLLTPKDPSLSNALRTKVFIQDGEERRVPVHRSVAEYLGAKYLADLVNSKSNPLRFERVLALMPDKTGAIASDLRGLCAWLAVHCTGRERKILIRRDSLGLVIYGDVSDFSCEEKKLILNTFKDKAKNADDPHFNSSFGGLGTIDMAPVFRGILASPSHTIEQQKLYMIVLAAIAHGQPMPELKDILENIIQNHNYTSRVRCYAIEALINCGDCTPVLLKIAEDIRNGIFEDRDDEVLGKLLVKLYPERISANEILSYFHQRKSPDFLGCYYRFWSDIVISTQDESLPVLLDQLVQKKVGVKWMADDYGTKRWMGKLLGKGLEIYGEKINDQCLYEWLSLGINEFGNSLLSPEEAQRIATWFEAHPEKYKTVIEYGAIFYAKSDNFDSCMSGCLQRLQKTKCPADMLEWYQEKMEKMLKEHPQIAKFYLKQAILLVMLDNNKLALIKLKIEKFPILLQSFEELMNPIEDLEKEILSSLDNKNQVQKKEKIEWAAHFREHLKSMREGTAPFFILYNLAQTHNSLFVDIDGATPDERLKKLLDDDQELVDAAYSSLKSAMFREDLPTLSQIIKLATQGQMHFIHPACLISVAELYKNDPHRITKLNANLLRQLLAFHFADDRSEKGEPEWVLALINESPALVEEVLSKYIVAMTKAKKEFISPLLQMVDGAYTSFAPTILPALLEKFPLRVSQTISRNLLTRLLGGAIQFLDKKTLEVLIDKKLINPSMDAIQKIYWLACGFIIAPTKFTEKLQQHIANRQAYHWHLSNFIQNNWAKNKSFTDMDENSIGFLIELLAPKCSPEWPLSPHQATANVVYSLIYKLEHNSNKESGELERLLSISSISNWHPILDRALHVKKINQGISSFRYLEADKIAATLENGPPANAADLCALTMVYLREIANDIHNGNTNDKKQYWCYDEKNKKPTTPKHENDCRDVLLSDLKQRLRPYQVTADREASYADDKRADIKVSLNDFSIPIEVKKEDSGDLWTAIDKQLIKKYIRDPGTGGYGIYIVFWFGEEKDKIIDRTDGAKIQSPEQLENRLRQRLSEEVSRRVEILVIDCSLLK